MGDEINASNFSALTNSFDIYNNIHVYLTVQSKIEFEFELGGVSFLINRAQTIFIGKGIPIIQEKNNIYDISKLSDVIFHIV